MAIIGIDLGGTKLSSALFSPDGTIFSRYTNLLEYRAGTEVGELIIEHITKLFKTATEKNSNVEAIGISVPGIANRKENIVWAPNIRGWDKYPLLNEIKTYLNNEKINVIIESDRSCYIMGEVWQGAAKGCSNAIFLAIGTGIGAGILSDGHVLHGANDIAGALGWLALHRPFSSKYIQCGCFEYQASGEGISRMVKEYIAGENNYNGTLKTKSFNELKTKDVFEAYEQGDSIAIQVFNNCIELWGMTVANLVSIFNPEKIIFGGGVFGPATRFLNEILNEAKKWAQPISITKVTLETSALGGDAGLIGAGYCALKSQSKPQ